MGLKVVLAASLILLPAGTLAGDLASPPPAPTPPIQILYTGELLGYTRLPDFQRLRQSGHPAFFRRSHALPGELPAKNSPTADGLLGLIHAQRKSGDAQTLTLGMGNNFAMNYYSRVAVAETTNQGHPETRFIPKDELYYHRRCDGWWDVEEIPDSFQEEIKQEEMEGKTTVDLDNVADFFRAAGYDALVPGKHDFYYGPERLRQLARYLATSDTPVAMLGANLIIRSRNVDSGPSKHESLRRASRQYFIEDLLDLDQKPANPMQWNLPKTTLPWNRRFHLRGGYLNGTKQFVNSARLCELPSDRDGLPSNCQPMTEHKSLVKPATDTVFIPNNAGALDSELTYAVCIDRPNASRPYCQPFDVLTPYFQYPEVTRPGYAGNEPMRAPSAPPMPPCPSNVISAQPNLRDLRIKPYLAKKEAGVVVFGVVEQGLEKVIGLLNSAWKNEKPGIDTQVETVDPAEALVQLIEYCRDQGDCPPGTRYVLMAQMPPTAAHVLARGLTEKQYDITVVLSRAERDFSTASQPASYAAGHSTVTLTPEELFHPKRDQKHLSLQVAKLNTQAGAHKLKTWSIHSTVGPDPNGCEPKAVAGSKTPERIDSDWQWCENKTDTDVLRKEINDAWYKLKQTIVGETSQMQTPKLDEQFRTVTLHALRETSRADVALMQQRDFFEAVPRLQSWPRSCRASVRERKEASIEQVLWKGDFAYTRTIKGSALKAALAESERLKTIEQDVYSIEPESGRWLQYFGLTQDPATKTWYVNGLPVEDNTLYSVAMTDFLAFGDTGYPQLQAPAVPPGKRVWDIKQLPRISEVVLFQLCELTTTGSNTRCPLPETNYDHYVDYSKHRAFKDAPTATKWDQLHAKFDEDRKAQPPLTKHHDALGQQRPYWRLFIDKAELSFSDYFHNRDTQSEVASDFGGVTEDGVNQRAKLAHGTAFQVELRREWKRAHAFTRFEESFLNERTLQDNTPRRFQDNFKTNALSLETGARAPFWRSMRQRPWLGLVGSLSLTSQLRSPQSRFAIDVQCEACPKDPADAEIIGTIPKTERAVGKLGLRLEGSQSWFEIGVFRGRVRRPTRFSVLGSGISNPGSPCLLGELDDKGKPIPVATCLKTRFPVQAPDSNIDDLIKGLSLKAEPTGGPESGLFLNFNWRFDFPKGWFIKQFVLENRGRLFFIHSATNTAVDARYIERFSAGPTIPIVESLSLKPTYSLLFYKNKLADKLLRGQSFEMKLEYRFDWKTGSSPKQVLRFGRP